MADRLWIKYSDADRGERPAQGTCWLSPSVTVSPAPKVDQQSMITVVVDAAEPVSGVSLQAWAARFGSVPLAYIASMGGNTGRVRTGLSSTTSVVSGVTRHTITQQIAWTPLAGDESTALQHLCLQANCWIPNVEGAQQGTAGMPAIDIVGNRHHAQHNITVLPRNSPVSLDVDYGNNRKADEDVILEALFVRELTLSAAEHRRLVAFLHARGGHGKDDKRRDELPWKPGRGRPRKLELHRRGEPPRDKVRLSLKPGERGRLRVLADFDDDDDGLYAVDFVQRDRRGNLMGGARILIPPPMES